MYDTLIDALRAIGSVYADVLRFLADHPVATAVAAVVVGLSLFLGYRRAVR